MMNHTLAFSIAAQAMSGGGDFPSVCTQYNCTFRYVICSFASCRIAAIAPDGGRAVVSRAGLL
ncbi:hypothetical protein GL279_14725 [Paracoccus limosus]|jgi:hypothetical protein|uniref:Uncharacterized protein n=1 Tax=Paracoccus limosus TaxID=913252 RepID=A0A844H4F0_9RHOB|nr:hypothetical protein [Paracoccus limosus]